MTRLHLGPVILTVIVAGLAATLGSERKREAAVPQPSVRAVAAPLAAPRACATAWGLCPIPHVRIGDPCGCPHPLHGVVRGRTISLGGGVTPAIGRLRGDDADELPRRLGPRRDE